MEWYTILILFLLIILFVIVGIVIACMLSGQRCTISIQQRTPNYELTRMKQEQEEKRQKKFSTKLKKALNPSSKPEEPLAPVENVKSVELTFKLGDDQKNSEQITVVNEPLMIPLQQSLTSQAEREARQKRREELKRKYNL